MVLFWFVMILPSLYWCILVSEWFWYVIIAAVILRFSMYVGADVGFISVCWCVFAPCGPLTLPVR